MTSYEPSSPDKVSRFFAFIEGWGPLVLSVAAAIVAFVWARERPLPGTLDNLLNATVGLSAIAVGFLATAKSILLSMNDRWVVKQLKKVGYYQRLMGYFMGAIRWSFALAALSAFGLLIDFQTDKQPHPFSFAVWIFTLVGTGACSYRVIHLFTRILRTAA